MAALVWVIRPHMELLVIAKACRSHAPPDSMPGALHAFGFLGGMALLAGLNGVHGLVDGRCRAFCGLFRFVSAVAECLVVVAWRLQHVPQHGRQFRCIPRFAALLFLFNVMSDFCVLFRGQGKPTEGAVRAN